MLPCLYAPRKKWLLSVSFEDCNLNNCGRDGMRLKAWAEAGACSTRLTYHCVSLSGAACFQWALSVHFWATCLQDAVLATVSTFVLPTGWTCLHDAWKSPFLIMHACQHAYFNNSEVHRFYLSRLVQYQLCQRRLWGPGPQEVGERGRPCLMLQCHQQNNCVKGDQTNNASSVLC